MVPVERHAGFLRVAIIYFICGIGGYFVSGLFVPGDVAVGPDPAVYGFLGVHFVELFQAWQIIPKPWISLLKLFSVTIVLLMIGTLPYIDNWSHLGGFIFGMISGIIFLPYVTFGAWDLRRKRCLFLFCFPLLIGLFVTVIIFLYFVQDTQFCPWCEYLNCVPYDTSLGCDIVDKTVAATNSS